MRDVTNTVGSHNRFTKNVQSSWGTICCWGTSLGDGALTSDAGVHTLQRPQCWLRACQSTLSSPPPSPHFSIYTSSFLLPLLFLLVTSSHPCSLFLLLRIILISVIFILSSSSSYSSSSSFSSSYSSSSPSLSSFSFPFVSSSFLFASTSPPHPLFHFVLLYPNRNHLLPILHLHVSPRLFLHHHYLLLLRSCLLLRLRLHHLVLPPNPLLFFLQRLLYYKSDERVPMSCHVKRSPSSVKYLSKMKTNNHARLSTSCRGSNACGIPFETPRRPSAKMGRGDDRGVTVLTTRGASTQKTNRTALQET